MHLLRAKLYFVFGGGCIGLSSARRSTPLDVPTDLQSVVKKVRPIKPGDLQSPYSIDMPASAWVLGITYPQSIKRLGQFLTADCKSAGTPNGGKAYPALGVNVLKYANNYIFPPKNFSISRTFRYFCSKKENMKILKFKLLKDFARKHPDSADALMRWAEYVEKTEWKSHAELKQAFPSADYVGNDRYVFNISGNKFRLVTIVVFFQGFLHIRFVGTHAEYDKIKDIKNI